MSCVHRNNHSAEVIPINIHCKEPKCVCLICDGEKGKEIKTLKEEASALQRGRTQVRISIKYITGKGSEANFSGELQLDVFQSPPRFH